MRILIDLWYSIMPNRRFIVQVYLLVFYAAGAPSPLMIQSEVLSQPVLEYLVRIKKQSYFTAYLNIA